MEVVGMISGVVSLLETTGRAYDKLKKMKDLPQAFLEVHQRLPIAQEILKAIDAKYDQFTVADARLIAPTVQSCHKNAKALKAILERLPPRDDVTSSWDTLVKQYITIVKIQGKGERVEDLTKKILRDIQLLVNFEIIKKNEVTKSNQLQKLKDAIEAIERVDPSVSTHELQAGGFGSITHGGQGDQNFQMGDYNNQFNHSGSGNNIKEANFAGSSAEERRNKALERLGSSLHIDQKDGNPEADLNTCVWLTGHEKFQTWLQTDETKLLWVSADPGCGKSVLARHLVDKVLPSLPQPYKIIYFFFKEDSDNQKKAEFAVKSLLFQILEDGSPLFTDRILGLLEERDEASLCSFGELWNILAEVFSTQSARNIFCVLDALDECEDEGWIALAGSLKRFYESHTTGPKLFLLSRPYDRLRSCIQENIPAIHLHGEAGTEATQISAEIDLVVERRIKSLSKHMSLDEEEEEEVRKKLFRTRNRTYLWAHLACKMLWDEDRLVHNGLSDLLDTIPYTVEEAYDKILRKSSNIEKARKILQIVVAAARPLSLNEMATAVAVEQRQSPTKRPAVLALKAFQTSIRNICGLFLVVRDDKIYLIHQTAREFLIKDISQASRTASRSATSLQWQGCLDLVESNRLMAGICIQYLIYVSDYEPLSPVEPPDSIVTPPMFDYAATHWVSHYRSWNLDGSSEYSSDIVRLCDTMCQSCVIWQNIFEGNNNREIWLENIDVCNGSNSMTSLELMSYLGLEIPFKKLLDEGKYDLFESEALAFAATSGHHEMVKRIIDEMRKQQDFFARRRDVGMQLPLMWAAGKGHEAIIDTLMNFKRTGIDRPQKTTPSYVAQIDRSTSLPRKTKSDGGSAKSRRRKRSHPLRPDLHDSQPERMALGRAAEKGQLAIVRKLLEDFKVDPVYVKDIGGHTAFSDAAACGHVDVVKFLLKDRRVNPDMTDPRDRLFERSAGQTPLSLAAKHGHPAVVKILLKSGKVRPHSRDDLDRTPLSHAAENGHLDVVKMLLKTDGVDINSKDADGTTPLEYACSDGHFEIVKTFLNTGSVGEEPKNHSLTLAVDKGHEDIVGLLLSSDGFDAKLGNERKTELISLAMKHYCLSVLRLLYGRWNTDLGLTRARRILNGSLIAQAVMSTVDVFEYIVDVGQLDINFEYSWESENGNIHYSTLLRRAAKEGESGIVKALLSKNADVNLRSGRKGETALYTGVKCGHWAVVDALLQAEGIDLSLRCKKGFTPRLMAEKRIARHQLSPGHRYKFERILDRLNEHILAMPDCGEALESLERTILEGECSH